MSHLNAVVRHHASQIPKSQTTDKQIQESCSLARSHVRATPLVPLPKRHPKYCNTSWPLRTEPSNPDIIILMYLETHIIVIITLLGCILVLMPCSLRAGILAGLAADIAVLVVLINVDIHFLGGEGVQVLAIRHVIGDARPRLILGELGARAWMRQSPAAL